MRTEECVFGEDVIAPVTGRERFFTENTGTEMTGYSVFICCDSRKMKQNEFSGELMEKINSQLL